MSKIVIKKRVNLDFLGEDYKDAYLVFRSIPLPELDDATAKMPDSDPRYLDLVIKAQTEKLTDGETAELQKLQVKEKENNKQAFVVMLELLKQYFLSGKFPDAETNELHDVSKEDLDGIDRNATVECFNRFTGVTLDPKAENQSSSPSSTESSTPQ